MSEKLATWVSIPEDSDFTIYNLPYGIYSRQGETPRAGVAIGSQIIDLDALQKANLLIHSSLPEDVFVSGTLNDFISCGHSAWAFVRKTLTSLLTDSNSDLKHRSSEFLIEQSAVQMHMPVTVGDYTDFYSSLEHATNIGTMFRGKDNALMPNWKHIPVGYHGRASSIVVSGTPIHRPKGQMLPNDVDKPVFGPTKLLDIELEMAFVVGKPNELGTSVSVEEAEGHIFGMVIFNDWSARDIQKWEYVPLGPFLGKSFASSISPWIVTMDALQPFRVKSPEQDVEVLPYLQGHKEASYDIDLEAWLTPDGGKSTKICHSNHKHLYWTMAQQLAHHTVNGCNLRVGDMCASGTISGPTPDSYGSLLELTWRGEKPLKLADGSERKFLLDHDVVTMRAYAVKGEKRVGFGEVSTKILPAKD